MLCYPQRLSFGAFPRHSISHSSHVWNRVISQFSCSPQFPFILYFPLHSCVQTVGGSRKLDSLLSTLLHCSNRRQEDGGPNVTNGMQHRSHHQHFPPVLRTARAPGHPDAERIQTAGEKRAAKLSQGKAGFLADLSQSGLRMESGDTICNHQGKCSCPSTQPPKAVGSVSGAGFGPCH